MDYNTAVNLALILDISAFCVEHHTYHIKNYVISKDLLRRILVLMKSEHKFLVLGESPYRSGFTIHSSVTILDQQDVVLIGAVSLEKNSGTFV